MCTSFVSGRLSNRKLFIRVKHDKLQRRIHHGKYIRFDRGIGTAGYHKSMGCPSGGQKIQARRGICALPPALPNAAGTIDLSSCSRSQTLCCRDHSCLLSTAVGVEIIDTNLRIDMQGRLFLYNPSGLLTASGLPPGGTGVMDAVATTPTTGVTISMSDRTII
jgi:hypothetical protein